MNEAFRVAVTVLMLVMAGLTLPGSLELVLVTLGGVLPPRSRSAQRLTLRRLACVVPAHDEAAGIAECIESLRAAAKVRRAEVVVVADNCRDETAAVARSHRARVLERIDPQRRGKGYALQFAFEHLIPGGADAVLVVDADTRVAPNFIAEMAAALEAGAGAVQCRYLVANADASLRTRLMQVALLAFNVLRPRGRDRWGLSAGIFGNGFGLTSETLETVPYTATSIVEDLEYHLRLVEHGIVVCFADRTCVYGDMPAAGKGVRTQRVRWEGGRLRILNAAAPKLMRGVLGGHGRFVEPLLDLLLPPLGLQVALLTITLVAPLAGLRLYGAVGLAVVGVHVLTAIAVGGGGRRELKALAMAPFYIVWKIAMLPAILRSARTHARWVRTERRESTQDL